MRALSGNNFYIEMDGTAFAYAGLTGDGLVAQLRADGSRRLLATQVSRTTLCDTLHTVRERPARRLLLARVRPGTDTVPVYGKVINDLAAR